MLNQALAEVVRLHRWQIEKIEKAVKETNAGLFLSDEETAAFMDELGQ